MARDLTAKPPPKAAAGFRMPATLAGCADMLYTLKRERAEAQKKVDELKERESALTEHLIANLPKSDALGVVGKVARATIVNKSIGRVDDWDKYYDYILKHARKNPGVWALLQRRPNEATIREMAAGGKPIPGTDVFEIPQVSLNKV